MQHAYEQRKPPLHTCAATLPPSPQISEHDVRIVRTLGSGASGVVQKAFLPRESRFVAIKKISVLERDKRHQVGAALVQVGQAEGQA